MTTEIVIHEQSFEKDFDEIDYYPHIEDDSVPEEDTFGYYN